MEVSWTRYEGRFSPTTRVALYRTPERKQRIGRLRVTLHRNRGLYLSIGSLEGHLVLLDCRCPCYFPPYSFQAASQDAFSAESIRLFSSHRAQYSSHSRKRALTDAFRRWFKPKVTCNQPFLASTQTDKEKRTSTNRTLDYTRGRHYSWLVYRTVKGFDGSKCLCVFTELLAKLRGSFETARTQWSKFRGNGC